MRPRPVAFSLSIGGVVAAAASRSRSLGGRLAFRVRAPSCRSCLPPGSFVAWWQTLTAARWRAVFRSAPCGRSAEDVTPPSTWPPPALAPALLPPPLLHKRCPLGATPPAGLFVGYRSPVLAGYWLPCSTVVPSLPLLDQRLFGLCLFRAAARFITLGAPCLRLSAHWRGALAANHPFAACSLPLVVRLRPSLRSSAAPRRRRALVGRALPLVARPSPQARLCYALPTLRLTAQAPRCARGYACDKWHAELLSRCSGPS